MDDVLAQVGPRLRAARHARGLTLEELASRAAVSPSTLSRLESGKRQASLELLVPLTRHLGIRIDDLLPDAPADPRVRRPVIHREGHVLVPLATEGSAIQVYRITYPPRTEPPEPRVHDGHEWLYVLTGRLHLLLGGQDLVLEQGEAAQFDTRVPHAMWAEGRRPASALSVFNESGEAHALHVPDPIA